MLLRPSRVAILLAAVIFALSLVAHGDGTLPGDVRLARWLQAHPIPLADPLTSFTNAVASGLPLTVVAIALALGLLAARRREAALLLALATALRAVNPLLKAIIDSPRPAPDAVRVSEHAAGLGFPSGHAMGATLVFGALACLLWTGGFRVESASSPDLASPRPRDDEHDRRDADIRRPRGRTTRRALSPRDPVPVSETASQRAFSRLLERALAILCLALIVLTGYGRIVVGAHWPSDVLGGELWGCLLLALALRVVRVTALPSPAIPCVLPRREPGLSPDRSIEPRDRP